MSGTTTRCTVIQRAPNAQKNSQEEPVCRPKVTKCQSCGNPYRPGMARRSPYYCSKVCQDRGLAARITKTFKRMINSLGLFPSKVT